MGCAAQQDHRADASQDEAGGLGDRGERLEREDAGRRFSSDPWWDIDVKVDGISEIKKTAIKA